MGWWWEINAFWTSIPRARRLSEDPGDSALGLVPGRAPVSHSPEPLVAALKREAFLLPLPTSATKTAALATQGITRQIPGCLWDLHGCNDAEIHKRDPRDMPSPIAPNFALSNLEPGSARTRASPDPSPLSSTPLEGSRKAAAPLPPCLNPGKHQSLFLDPVGMAGYPGCYLSRNIWTSTPAPFLLIPPPLSGRADKATGWFLLVVTFRLPGVRRRAI